MNEINSEKNGTGRGRRKESEIYEKRGKEKAGKRKVDPNEDLWNKWEVGRKIKKGMGQISPTRCSREGFETRNSWGQGEPMEMEGWKETKGKRKNEKEVYNRKGGNFRK